MTQLAWWPVVLILLAAPFGVYGYGWVERQHMLAAHSRQLTSVRGAAEKARAEAYADGRAAGIAEVRVGELVEVEKTREAMRELEAELEAARAANAPVPTPAELLLACKRSVSCRERGELK